MRGRAWKLRFESQDLQGVLNERGESNENGGKGKATKKVNEKSQSVGNNQ